MPADWDWIDNALVDEVIGLLKTGTSDPLVNVTDVARRLGVTPNAVRRAIRKLDQVSLSQVTRITEPHPFVRDLIARHGDQQSLLNLVSWPK